MLKLDLKLIFWSLAVHRYPKQPPRVIIFAAMGPGMKLVIDGNFLAEKNENLKFFCKTYVIYIKRKLRTCRIQIQEEKVWFLFKKEKKIILLIFFPMSEQSKNFFFSFFKIFNFFLKNGPRGPRKFEKKQSHEIWAYLERPQRRHTRSSTGACTLYHHHPPHPPV